jgi:sulfotransferase family protein
MDPNQEGRRETAPIVFVGGTGRSGTHVIAQLLCRSTSLALIPVETRFHVDDGGLVDLVDGRVSKQKFVRRLRGFWWKGFQTNRLRGLHRMMDRERFDAAVAAFEERFDSDPDEAARRLLYDLLWWRAERKEAQGIVEQSCRTVARGEGLARLFPEARFVHVVRDGRDASASRVAQTRGLTRPRTRMSGIRWWEERMRRIDAGARAIPPERLVQVSIDELVAAGSAQSLKPLCDFAGIPTGHRVRKFYKWRMGTEQANQGRWRAGLSDRRAKSIEAEYLRALDRLEADGVSSVPLLRRSFERTDSRAEEPPLLYVWPTAESAGS